jgi:heme oxygenase
MSTLKELTWEHHKEAERQEFVKVLLSGKIHPEFYATYLWNQHKKYDLLEALASLHGLLDELPGIRRKNKIEADFVELWKDNTPPPILPAVDEYIAHMRTIMDDAEKITAHLYVMHMGELSGGQMIAKKVPGSATMYQFDGDHTVLKDTIRAMTADSMAEEAGICFDFATKTFKDMMEIDCERYLEHTD